METTNYKVDRDKIYVGPVVKINNPGESEIYPEGIMKPSPCLQKFSKECNDAQSFMYDQRPMVDFGIIHPFVFERRMFFILDETRKANDLLYCSPHYPVSLISLPEDCLTANIAIAGTSTYKMDKILQYFHYPKVMNYEDVLKMQEIFTFDFKLIHSESFGVYSFFDFKSYQEFINKFDPLKLHKPPEISTISDDGMFKGKEIKVLARIDGPIHHSYYDALRYLSNSMENGVEKDFSVPTECEGMVKQLRK